jgi:protein-disulfide isomerase
MNSSRLPLVLSIAALVTAGVSWFISAGQIEELRESQRALVTDVAALQKSPVIDVTGSPARGAEDAVVTLVEFSDYECPFCIRHFKQTMPKIDETYVQTGKVRYVFRDFPVDQLHPAAIRAHEAGRCADEQGKFWALHDRLFSPAGSHTPEALEARATEAGLSLDGFRACVASGRHTSGVRASASEAMGLGANGTPAFFIGLRDRATGQVKVLQAISGAHPYEVFSRAIEAALKRAG